MSTHDPHIVTGMDAIVNPDNIKPGIDLKELERRMISGGLIQQKIKDPQDKFNDELKDAAQKLGISFGEFTTKNTSQSRSSYSVPAPARPQPSLPTLDSGYSGGGYGSSSGGGGSSNNKDDEDEDEEGTNEDEEEDDEEEQPKSSPPAPSYSSSRTGGSSPPPQSYSSENRFSSEDRPRFGGDLRTRTQEQERRAHIDSVMGVAEGTSSFSFEKEKREDMKCAMLAEIDSLMSSLAEEDVDLTRIPKVDRNSSYEEVDSVLKMLRHKNDHTRYCSFAEEFLLFGAYALEELFDGKRTWFGRYQPDLTGWHNHVNVKLKRMRHDTGQLVSGVMQDYNIGPGARVLLELVPNMVLYSKMKKQQHNQPGLFSDEEMAQVNNRLREAS